MTLGIGLVGCENKAAGAEQEYYRFTSISAGYYHVVGLAEDGTLWSWGSNGKGQLGDGTTTKRNTPVKIQIPK